MPNSTATPLKEKILNLYPTLSKGQQRIANYVLNNMGIVLNLSISELSNYCGFKSEASIVMFYKRLGYESYKELKLAIAKETDSKTLYQTSTNITFDDNSDEIVRKVFSGCIDTMSMNMNSLIAGEIKLAGEILSTAKQIVLIGYATSAAHCYYAYFRFLELGFQCHFSTDSHINALVLSQCTQDDVIFCVSHSGETQDLLKLLERRASKDAKTVLLTGTQDSTLSRMSDATICLHSSENNLLTDSMNSRITQFCVIDALFSVIGTEKGQNAISNLISAREVFLDYKIKK